MCIRKCTAGDHYNRFVGRRNTLVYLNKADILETSLFKRISIDEYVGISIKISLILIHEGPIE